jgi:hypothetical protein
MEAVIGHDAMSPTCRSEPIRSRWSRKGVGRHPHRLHPLGGNHGDRTRRRRRKPLVTQGIVLAAVGIGITVIVYGAVGLIVKMDDIGLHLAQRRAAATQAIGRGLVLGCRS